MPWCKYITSIISTTLTDTSGSAAGNAWLHGPRRTITGITNVANWVKDASMKNWLLQITADTIPGGTNKQQNIHIYMRFLTKYTIQNVSTCRTKVTIYKCTFNKDCTNSVPTPKNILDISDQYQATPPLNGSLGANSIDNWGQISMRGLRFSQLGRYYNIRLKRTLWLQAGETATFYDSASRSFNLQYLQDQNAYGGSGISYFKGFTYYLIFRVESVMGIDTAQGAGSNKPKWLPCGITITEQVFHHCKVAHGLIGGHKVEYVDADQNLLCSNQAVIQTTPGVYTVNGTTVPVTSTSASILT